jgi:hypothetical protein
MSTPFGGQSIAAAPLPGSSAAADSYMHMADERYCWSVSSPGR